MGSGIGQHMLTAFAAEMDTGMDVIGNLSYGGSMRENTGQMNESEQAQANKINSIRHRVNDWKDHLEKNSLELPIGTLDSLALLEIVDSQAQNIAELSALFQKAGNGAVDLAMKCAEQAKELAEVRAIADAHRDTVMAYKFGNQP